MICNLKNGRNFFSLHKKFSIKDFLSKCDQNPQETTDLVTFAEESLIEDFIFCAVFFRTTSFIREWQKSTPHGVLATRLSLCQIKELFWRNSWINWFHTVCPLIYRIRLSFVFTKPCNYGRYHKNLKALKPRRLK